MSRGWLHHSDHLMRLLSRHPDYLEQVQVFIADDPLAGRRRAIHGRAQHF